MCKYHVQTQFENKKNDIIFPFFCKKALKIWPFFILKKAKKKFMVNHRENNFLVLQKKIFCEKKSSFL